MKNDCEKGRLGLLVVPGAILLSALALVPHPAAAQEADEPQTVMAPGHQPPGAPLPRYIYNLVAADFSTGEDHPLIKSKFNLYDPVGPTMEQFDTNIDKMGPLKVDTYRLELAWGRRGTGTGLHETVMGTPENLEYNWGPMDNIVRKLHSQRVQFLAAYGYTPFPLQDQSIPANQGRGGGGGGATVRRDTSPPQDLEKWKEVVATVAKRYIDMGTPIGIHETWNEPDGTYGFYTGTPEEYEQLYKATAEAVKGVDPDAVVAGPGADHHLLWNESFPDFVKENNLPLDVYTFHEYGSGELVMRQIDRAAAALNRYDYFDETTLSLDEWHDADCCNWCFDDVRNYYEGASEVLQDFKLLLSRPELSSISWAWWLDPGRDAGCMGLITADDQRKAVYNAWKLYAMMPVDRRSVHIEGPLDALASSGEHTAGLLIWNNGSYDRRYDAHLRDLPFENGEVRVYRIDQEHASPGNGVSDELTPVMTYDLEKANWSWLDGIIPKYSVMYFEAVDGTGASELTAVDGARVVRINRYYPQRSETRSYADFDRNTWIARLGMADNAAANEQIGVLAEDLPDALDVTVDVEGELHAMSENSLLGVRIDYRVGAEEYGRSVLFHGPYEGVDLYQPDTAETLWGGRMPVQPWGLPGDPEVVRVADFSNFRIPVADQAPEGWTGRAHISFVMLETGADTRAKFKVRAAN